MLWAGIATLALKGSVRLLACCAAQDYKATKDFTSALKFLDPINILDRAQVHYERGLARHRRKKLPGASEDLSQALEMLQAQLMTADDEAKQQLQGMQAGWLTMHGLITADMGDTAAAIELHTKAIGIDAAVPSPWMNRASAYEAQERWEDAIADYSKRIELLPDKAANAYL
jgi:tetratricopeptide (TPR) repeat protein